MRPPDCAPLVATCSARAFSTMSRKSSSSVWRGACTLSMPTPCTRCSVSSTALIDAAVSLGTRMSVCVLSERSSVLVPCARIFPP